MKILIFSQFFWPENFRINDLCEELIRRGHEITVLTGTPNYPDGKTFPSYRRNPSNYSWFHGAEVQRVPVISRGSSSVRLILNYISFVISATILAPWKLRGRKFDAIFVFQTSPITAALPALFVARIKRAPVILWVLDLWPDTLSAIGVVTSRRMLLLVGRLVKFIYRRCALILVQSRLFRHSIVDYAGPQAKIRYFPGWAEAVFDSTSFGNMAPEMKPFALDFKIVFAGNLGEAQDFPAIVKAAELTRHIENLRWIIIGDGRAAASAIADVRNRGLDDKVVFLGRYPLERMPEFFSGADALLVSLAGEPIWSMTIPGKVQSYLGAGKPILGMLNGEGARVILEAGAGLVTEAGNAHGLARNVVAMMEKSATERHRLGRAGLAYGKIEFDRHMLIDRFEHWLNECSPSTNMKGAEK